MKICDLTQFYSPVSGGVKRYIGEKRRYVIEQTQDEHVLIVPGAKTEYIQEGRLHTYTIQSPRINRTSRYRILFSWGTVRDLLEDIRPDVIEAGDPYHLAWTALRAGRELHIPVLGFYHSHFPEAYLRTVLKYCGPWLCDLAMTYAQDYITRLYSQFSYTLVPSLHLKDLLQSWDVKNAVQVKLGVDTSSFFPGAKDQALKEELRLPSEAFVLLYVGRLAGDKNIATLLQAFEILKARPEGKNYYLVVVGDGPLRRLLPATRERTGALVWKSYVGQSTQLARYYRMADLFVHPGIYETFGLVALESQACGLPVAGIHGSYMDSNIFGGLEYWAQEKTPQAFAQTIADMRQLDLIRLGQNVSLQVRRQFAWSVVFAELWNYYQRAYDQVSRLRYY